MNISLNDILDKTKIIYIRTSIEYNKYHYPGSVNITRMILLKNPEKYINKNSKYYLLCSKGLLSNKTANILNALGYNCYSITGGIVSIKR